MSVSLALNHELVRLLKAGGVAVLRTDTLYGIVARADDKHAVERVYAIKHRNPQKSCIVLIDKPSSAYSHGDELELDMKSHHEIPTSFLLDGEGVPSWLLRDNDELAYRVPANKDLRDLLAQTGPLIAPSANPEGLEPAHTIEQARDYFGDAVDMYVDGGTVPPSTPPSRLLRIFPNGTVERLR